MNSKSIIFGLIAVTFAFTATSQKIVVDSSSTNKYIIKQPVAESATKPKEEEMSFGDRALSIGAGILNRLKARLNLEEASESLKTKKNKLLGKKDQQKNEEEEKKDPPPAKKEEEKEGGG